MINEGFDGEYVGNDGEIEQKKCSGNMLDKVTFITEEEKYDGDNVESGAVPTKAETNVEIEVENVEGKLEDIHNHSV